MKRNIFTLLAVASLMPIYANAQSESSHAHGPVSDQFIAAQRAALSDNTLGQGYGPQSPRNIDSSLGNNRRSFGMATNSSTMNLCNIHFHKNAEHQGGEFSKYAGNGDGKGYQSGYVYSGTLSASELKKINKDIGNTKHGGLFPGDTIEVHYVHSSAQVKPGPTLGSCLSDAIKNPQLRVETQVYVLVNDKNALDFVHLAKNGVKKGIEQALNIPSNTGTPIEYTGSTTGPSYNEKASPFQVTWSVRPKIAKVNIETVGLWLEDNIYDEDHGHGVRNLVTNPKLLSKIVR